jgi:hypothetical protein
MVREKLKWKIHKSESTDAGHGGGATRISDEVSVMETEQRGCIDRRYDVGNHIMGGTIE